MSARQNAIGAYDGMMPTTPSTPTTPCGAVFRWGQSVEFIILDSRYGVLTFAPAGSLVLVWFLNADTGAIGV